MVAKFTRRGQPCTGGELERGHDGGECLVVAGVGPEKGLLSLLAGGAGMTVHHWIMAEVGWGLPRGQRIFLGLSEVVISGQ